MLCCVVVGCVGDTSQVACSNRTRHVPVEKAHSLAQHRGREVVAGHPDQPLPHEIGGKEAEEEHDVAGGGFCDGDVGHHEVGDDCEKARGEVDRLDRGGWG